MIDKSDQFARFERVGEVGVRDSLAQHLYSDDRAALARHWLELREAARTELAQAEQLSLARRATEAAEEAASAARLANAHASIANKIAVAALVAAAIAIIVSIIGLLRSGA